MSASRRAIGHPGLNDARAEIQRKEIELPVHDVWRGGIPILAADIRDAERAGFGAVAAPEFAAARGLEQREDDGVAEGADDVRIVADLPEILHDPRASCGAIEAIQHGLQVRAAA